jgi:ParB family chromosome partitioning protein
LLRLPPEIQSAVRKNELSFGHARALVAIEDRAVQMHIFRRVVDRGISVREVERLARERGRTRRGRSASTAKSTAESSSLASVEERLRQMLATKVQVKPLRDGRGEIILEYYSADDLERILEIVLSSSS